MECHVRLYSEYGIPINPEGPGRLKSHWFSRVDISLPVDDLLEEVFTIATSSALLRFSSFDPVAIPFMLILTWLTHLERLHAFCNELIILHTQ